MFLFIVILLHQNHKFQFIGTILGQNLVARQRHLVLVSPVVECGQCICDDAAFSCKEYKYSFNPIICLCISYLIINYLIQPGRASSGLYLQSHQRG